MTTAAATDPRQRYARARTGRKLHITASESRTVCGAQINFSVADGRYSNDVDPIMRDLMEPCPKCER